MNGKGHTRQRELQVQSQAERTSGAKALRWSIFDVIKEKGGIGEDGWFLPKQLEGC